MVSYGYAPYLMLVYLLNLPFGYWRQGTKKFSKEWFLAIHVPVPLVFIIRMLSGTSLMHIPLFVTAFFLGQLSGGKIKNRLISN